MSAHVLLNLINELGKKIRCEAMPSILSVFPTEFKGERNISTYVWSKVLSKPFILKQCFSKSAQK